MTDDAGTGEKPRCLPCERITAQRRRLIDLVNDQAAMARLVSEVSALWGDQDCQILGALLWEAGFPSFPHLIPRYFAFSLQTVGWRTVPGVVGGQGSGVSGDSRPQAGDIFVVVGDRLLHSRAGVVAKHSPGGTWFKAFDCR